MLEVKGLSKTYGGGTQALRGVSLTVDKGMYGLLGPNGAGKTTLMRILATVLAPTSGTAGVAGVDIVRQAADARRLIGYLPQEFGTYGSLTVWEYLDYLGALSGLATGPRHRRIEALLEAVNLTDVQRRPTRALSGGMKRRLGVAQALLGDPALLIVDEPTAGLDPEERIRLRNLLADVAGERTVILSTHIVEDIAHTCGQMTVMRQGEAVFTGAPRDLVARAEGKVWAVETSEREAASLRARGRVTASVRDGDVFRLRLLADEQPAPGAQPVAPTLEDAYLDLMGGGVA